MPTYNPTTNPIPKDQRPGDDDLTHFMIDNDLILIGSGRIKINPERYIEGVEGERLPARLLTEMVDDNGYISVSYPPPSRISARSFRLNSCHIECTGMYAEMERNGELTETLIATIRAMVLDDLMVPDPLV